MVDIIASVMLGSLITYGLFYLARDIYKHFHELTYKQAESLSYLMIQALSRSIKETSPLYHRLTVLKERYKYSSSFKDMIDIKEKLEQLEREHIRISGRDI